MRLGPVHLARAAALAIAIVGALAAVPAIAADPAAVSAPAGKRIAPPVVEPILVDGLRFEAIHWGRQRGLDQNGGYIAALDPASGAEVWTLRVYEIVYDADLESDVQDLFIERFESPGDGTLIVIDEDGGRYVVNVAARAVVAD